MILFKGKQYLLTLFCIDLPIVLLTKQHIPYRKYLRKNTVVMEIKNENNNIASASWCAL